MKGNMNLKTIAGAALFALSYVSLHAQHREKTDEDQPAVYDHTAKQDSLKRVLHDLGTFEGHFRTAFMNTINRDNNPDYYALAIGGGLAYYSPVIRNFQLGLSGFIIYNLMSSELAPAPGFINRYELGLFDMPDPDNHANLDRLEELYIRYYLDSGRKSFVQAGKFHLRTPLMNLQDGRMRPNVQEGLWLQMKHLPGIQFAGGWIWSVSPRSTVEWYRVGESVGIYPSGRAVNGNPAAYAGNVDSKRVLIGNVGWQPAKNVSYQVWDYHADNLFNILLHKAEIRKNSASKTWVGGIQYLWQRSLSDASLPVEQQYISPSEHSHVFSGRVGFTNTGNSRAWSLNYTRITAHGRFLFPREWGVETFYTFIQRERNEGSGDVHAVMLEHSRPVDKDRQLSLRTRGGIYTMPPVTNAKLNKYAMPSYYQVSLETNYRFTGFFNGLEAQLLYTYKGNLDQKAESQPSLLHNKADMHHLTLRMDYYF